MTHLTCTLRFPDGGRRDMSGGTGRIPIDGQCTRDPITNGGGQASTILTV